MKLGSDIHSKGDKTNKGGILIERMRNVAILLNLIKLQHQNKSGLSDTIKNKYKIALNTMTKVN